MKDRLLERSQAIHAGEGFISVGEVGGEGGGGRVRVGGRGGVALRNRSLSLVFFCLFFNVVLFI